MRSPVFFRPALEPTLADVIGWTGVTAPEAADLTLRFVRVAPLDLAGPGDLTFLDNPRYAPALAGTRAAACIVPLRYADAVPPGTVGLVAKEPYRAVAIVAARLYPEAMRPGSLFGTVGISPSSTVHPEARLEPGVTVDPGAVIGPRAEVGSGTVVGPHAVIGPDVRIGRNCSVGANATVVHALVGDRVILHAGVRIGQDGFGFAMGPGGPPQGAADRARRAPGRRRGRRQHRHRPRLEPRHGRGRRGPRSITSCRSATTSRSGGTA